MPVFNARRVRDWSRLLHESSFLSRSGMMWSALRASLRSSGATTRRERPPLVLSRKHDREHTDRVLRIARVLAAGRQRCVVIVDFPKNAFA